MFGGVYLMRVIFLFVEGFLVWNVVEINERYMYLFYINVYINVIYE